MIAEIGLSITIYTPQASVVGGIKGGAEMSVNWCQKIDTKGPGRQVKNKGPKEIGLQVPSIKELVLNYLEYIRHFSF